MLDGQPLGEYPELSVESVFGAYYSQLHAELDAMWSCEISVGGAGRAEVFGPYFYGERFYDNGPNR